MKRAKEMLQNDLEQIERLVVAPTSDYIDLLDHIKRVLTKRNNKELDYIRFGDQLKALTEKQRSVSDEKKLAQVTIEYQAATKEFDSLNQTVKSDLIIFLSKKKDFIDPCLLTFYNYQIRVYQTLYSVFFELAQQKFNLETTAMQGYDAKRDSLNEMLARLTINQTKVDGRMSDNSRQSAVSNSSVSISQSRAAPIPPRPSIKPESKNYVVALFDYNAQAQGDLSFRKDDKIEVVSRKSDVNDWWTGKIGSNVGQFPGNYVRDISQ
jgi:amphiphysin